MHLFERVLLVSAEDIELTLRGHLAAPWADFLLNPRRLRGSDFLMRWSQGEWSEQRLVEAVNATDKYFALPYGPSGAAPDNDVREFELYFERLEAAGLGKLKRPDLLIFRKADNAAVTTIVETLGGLAKLPFHSGDSPPIRDLLALAFLAVECENSLWVAKQMPAYAHPLSPQKRMGYKLGMKQAAVLPTVIIKDEDLPFLRKWQEERKVPIHIWHAFYDLAFGLSLDRATELINQELIRPTVQTFQAPGGATTRKSIYKFYYHYAYELGEVQGEVELAADRIIDKNGHIMPYVRFQGGALKLHNAAMNVLAALASPTTPKV